MSSGHHRPPHAQALTYEPTEKTQLHLEIPPGQMQAPANSLTATLPAPMGSPLQALVQRHSLAQRLLGSLFPALSNFPGHTSLQALPTNGAGGSLRKQRSRGACR